MATLWHQASSGRDREGSDADTEASHDSRSSTSEDSFRNLILCSNFGLRSPRPAPFVPFGDSSRENSFRNLLLHDDPNIFEGWNSDSEISSVDELGSLGPLTSAQNRVSESYQGENLVADWLARTEASLLRPRLSSREGPNTDSVEALIALLDHEIEEGLIREGEEYLADFEATEAAMSNQPLESPELMHGNMHIGDTVPVDWAETLESLNSTSTNAQSEQATTVPSAGTNMQREQVRTINSSFSRESAEISGPLIFSTNHHNEVLGELQKSNITKASNTETNQESNEPKRANMTYEIETLLELGKSSKVSLNELRINVGVPSEHIFRGSHSSSHSNAVPSSRDNGSFETFSFPPYSADSNEEITYSGTDLRDLGQAVRQPFAPPSGNLAQKNEGFARFLREHASPPHKRVTAGGRIVDRIVEIPSWGMGARMSDVYDPPVQTPTKASRFPAEPTTPGGPTMLSSDQSFSVDRHNSKESDGAGKSQSYATEVRSAPSVSNTSRANKDASQDGNTNGVFLNQSQRDLVTALHLPSNIEYCGMTSMGDLIINMDGHFYHAFWQNGGARLNPARETKTFPADQLRQAYELPKMAPALQASIPQVVIPTQYPYYNTNPAPVTAHAPMPFAPMTQLPTEYLAQLDPQSQYRTLIDQQNALSSEQQGLKEYLAMHDHVLDPVTLASFIEKKKLLVRTIDNVRNIIRSIEENFPFVKQKQSQAQQQAPEIQLGHPSYHGEGNFQSVQRFPPLQPGTAFVNVSDRMMGQMPRNVYSDPYMHDKLKSSEPWENKSRGAVSSAHLGNGKSLSPNAPAFVPSGARPVTPEANTGIGAKQVPPNAVKSTQKISPKTHYPAPTSRNSWDFEMDLSEESMEYVNGLKLNAPMGPKVYCSTLEEIYQVVEQARRRARHYGSMYSESIDKKLDAQFDIQFAVDCHWPIPLASNPSDRHVNPRPWSWDDTLFNIGKETPYWWLPESIRKKSMDRDRAWRPVAFAQFSKEKDNLVDTGNKQASFASDTDPWDMSGYPKAEGDQARLDAEFWVGGGYLRAGLPDSNQERSNGKLRATQERGQYGVGVRRAVSMEDCREENHSQARYGGSQAESSCSDYSVWAVREPTKQAKRTRSSNGAARKTKESTKKNNRRGKSQHQGSGYPSRKESFEIPSRQVDHASRRENQFRENRPIKSWSNNVGNKAPYSVAPNPYHAYGYPSRTNYVASNYLSTSAQAYRESHVRPADNKTDRAGPDFPSATDRVQYSQRGNGDLAQLANIREEERRQSFRTQWDDRMAIYELPVENFPWYS